MQGKSKNVLLIALVIGIVSMVVAYAALSTELRISSSAKVAATKWDIQITSFAQAAAQPNNVSGTSEVTVTGPNSTAGTTIQGLEVTFKKPGDVAKFTFNLENAGDIDAKLTGFTLGNPDGTDVTKEVKCGNTTKATPTIAPDTAMNLSKKTNNTNGSIACEMTLTLSNNATIPTGSATTVTIPDTVFVYGQN